MLSKPTRVAPELTCPEALRNIPGWLVWKLEANPNPKKKPLKVPYYPKSGRRRLGVQGDEKDLSQLVTFDDAVRVLQSAKGYTGVGFCCLEPFGVLAVDYDGCVDSTGKIHPEVVNDIAGTYSEISPSGTGVRAFFLGDLGNVKDHDRTKMGYGVELFSTAGFVTFTGNTTDVCTIFGDDNVVAPVTPGFKAMVEGRFGRTSGERVITTDVQPEGFTEAQIKAALSAVSPTCGYDEWMRVGMAVHHETQGSIDGFELWHEWSQGGDNYGSAEECEAKWDSFGRNTGRQVTIGTLIKMAAANGVVVRPNYAAVFEDISDAANDPIAPPLRRNRIQTATAFVERKPLDYLIKGFIPKAGLILHFGQSASGKSFATLDHAVHIALGRDWRGRKVRKARVLYIVAEGDVEFTGRVKAICKHMGVSLDQLAVDFVPGAYNLLIKREVEALIADMNESGPYGLVIVDTYAQSTSGGDENSSRDVGIALASCRRIYEETGASVYAVHHAGKTANKGPRGHSSIFAACDMVMETSRIGSRHVTEVTKSKGGVCGEQFVFEILSVNVGTDEDGDAILAGVATPLAGEAAPIKWQPKTEYDQRLIAALAEMQEQAIARGDVFAEVSEVELVRRAAALAPEPEKPENTDATSGRKKPRDRRVELHGRRLDNLLDTTPGFPLMSRGIGDGMLDIVPAYLP